MKVGKVWGITECILQSPFVEVHRLYIEPNHQCSLHVHQRKWNAFLVLSGELFIDVVKNDYALTDVTQLGVGEITSVRPGEYHRFRTGDKPCDLVEFYYPDGMSEDIVRKDHGGPT